MNILGKLINLFKIKKEIKTVPPKAVYKARSIFNSEESQTKALKIIEKINNK